MPGAVLGTVSIFAYLSNPYTIPRGRYCYHPHFISEHPEARGPKVTQPVSFRAGIQYWAQPGSASVPFHPAPSCPPALPYDGRVFLKLCVPSSCGMGFPAPPILLVPGGSRMVSGFQVPVPRASHSVPGSLSGVLLRGEDPCRVHLGE